MADKLLNWKEARMGGAVTEAGSATEYQTGTWRSMRPVHDAAQCTSCMTCWVYCPDASIVVENGKMVGFDYDHCKGCGICANVCAVKTKKEHAVTGKLGKVIQMIPER